MANAFDKNTTSLRPLSRMNPSRKPAILFIFFTLLIDVIGFGIIIPVLPSLISELTGEGMSAASRYGGWLMFAFSLMQFVFSPVLGNLSDRLGRRPILLFSLFGFGLDYLLLALSPSITWLFIGRVIAGITGASFTTASAYIADISTPENRGQNFGMIGAAFGLGFIIGPVLGGLLGTYGSRVPFYAAALLTLVNWLYGFFVLPESLSKENRRSFNWKRANPVSALLHLKSYPGIIGLVMALFFTFMASHSVQSTWSYFTMGEFKWTEAEVGYSLGFVGVLVALVQTVLIRLSTQKFGSQGSVYLGLACYIVGLLTFAFAQSGWWMYIGLIPYCLSGLAGPSMQGIISGKVPANAQGELQGGLTSIMSITAILGPLLMTHLYSTFSDPQAPFRFPGAPFLMGMIFSCISLLVAYRSLHSRFKRT